MINLSSAARASAIVLSVAVSACVAAPAYEPAAPAYAQAPGPGPACGIRGYPQLPVGSAVVEATFTQADRPFMGFGASPVPIVRAAVLSPPCQGHLERSARPLGFRYVPRPGYVGNDSYVIQGCTARGQCVPQAVVIAMR